jgi:hypothetical protein
VKNSTLEIDFEYFLKSLDAQILNSNDKDELISKKNQTTLLNEFMSIEERTNFTWKKSWINDKMKSKYLIFAYLMLLYNLYVQSHHLK